MHDAARATVPSYVCTAAVCMIRKLRRGENAASWEESQPCRLSPQPPPSVSLCSPVPSGYWSRLIPFALKRERIPGEVGYAQTSAMGVLLAAERENERKYRKQERDWPRCCVRASGAHSCRKRMDAAHRPGGGTVHISSGRTALLLKLATLATIVTTGLAGLRRQARRHHCRCPPLQSTCTVPVPLPSHQTVRLSAYHTHKQDGKHNTNTVSLLVPSSSVDRSYCRKNKKLKKRKKRKKTSVRRPPPPIRNIIFSVSPLFDDVKALSSSPLCRCRGHTHIHEFKNLHDSHRQTRYS